MPMRRLLFLGLLVVVGAMFIAGPAHAQYAGGSPPQAGPVASGIQTKVLGEHFTAAGPNDSSAGNENFLASTGVDIAELVGIAALAIGVGTVMVRRRHRPIA